MIYYPRCNKHNVREPAVAQVIAVSRIGPDQPRETRTHGSFLIRRQRGHPGVVLPLVVSNLTIIAVLTELYYCMYHYGYYYYY